MPLLQSQHPLFELHARLVYSYGTLAELPPEAFYTNIATRAFELADKDHSFDRLLHIKFRYVLDWQNGKPEIRRSHEPSPARLCLSLNRSEYERIKSNEMARHFSHGKPRAYIALGSNVGDRVNSIEAACQEMTDRGVRVLRTSALYETKPMYLEDQRNFVNGVCEVCEQINLRHSLLRLTLVRI